MAVRSTMTALISRVRDLIGDPAGTSAPQFTDQQVQDALDRRRADPPPRYHLLRPAPTLTQGGIYNYTDYFADVGDWEDGVVLTWADFSTLTPATTDLLMGHWTFALPTPGQLPPVYATGYVYDVWGAAADLLEAWAALWARKYAFTAGGQAFQRQQAYQQMMAQAQAYRAKQRPQVGRLRRADVTVTGDASPEYVLGLPAVSPWEW